MSNKKIRNATITKQGNITFKSVLEKTCFNLMVEAGLSPLYEPERIVVYNGFKPMCDFYDKETDSQHKKRIENTGKQSGKILVKNTSNIQPITYTPDFYVKYNDIDFWIEAKGIQNDVFPYKKKLFRRYLDNHYIDTGTKSVYIEVYSKKQMQQAIEIIKSYAE